MFSTFINTAVYLTRLKSHFLEDRMKKLLTLFVVLLMSVSAFGVIEDPEVQELTFTEFQNSCENPENFGRQVEPDEIKVECSMEEFIWEEAEEGIFELPSINYLTAELFSNKYHVDEINFCGDTEESTGICPNYIELKGTLTVEKDLTCEDVDNTTLEEICINYIASIIANNPDAVEYGPTQRQVNVCEDDVFPEY